MSVAIPSLYVLAGLLAYAALNHALLGSQYVGRRAVHGLAGAMCLLMIAFVLNNAWAFAARSPEEFVQLRRENIAIASTCAIVMLWFVARYTGMGSRFMLTLLTGLLLASLLVNLALPLGISFAELPRLVPFVLPWGEVLIGGTAPNSPLRGLFTISLNLTLVYCVVLAFRHWRQTALRVSLVVLVAFTMMLVLSLQGTLARWGLVRVVPLGPWAFALLPFALSLALNDESGRQDRRLREIIERLPALVAMRALDGRYLLTNRYLSTLLGAPEADFVGRTGRELPQIAPALAERIRAQDGQVLQAGRALTFDETLPSAEGTRHYSVLRYPVLREDGQATAICTIATDVTERKRSEAELAERRAHLEALVAERSAEIARQRDEIAHLANHDALTGLPTLRLARDRLAQACEQAMRTRACVALMFIDLDGFKAANDTHGHEAGDHVLVTVARRLTATLRAGDTAARQGGDEFIVILNGVDDASAAMAVAEKLLAAIAAPIHYDQVVVPIGASIGIALFPEHADAPEALLRCADQAMYAVKKAGKNACRLYAADARDKRDTAAAPGNAPAC